jgi:succinate-semialdehyde dehydrogenase/glutarate-semialdehyde dehydrogenase
MGQSCVTSKRFIVFHEHYDAFVSAQRVAARLDAGMVWINRPAASRPELPFGGIIRSGYGRELGAAGIDEVANCKLICAVAPDAPVGGFAG